MRPLLQKKLQDGSTCVLTDATMPKAGLLASTSLDEYQLFKNWKNAEIVTNVKDYG